MTAPRGPSIATQHCQGTYPHPAHVRGNGIHCPGTTISEAQGGAVDHPQHYGGDTPHEVIKCLEAWGLNRNAYLFNVVKYVARAGRKGDVVEDLKKARFYLDREINNLERSAGSDPPDVAG